MFNKKRIHKMNPKRDTWNQPKSYHEEKKIYSLALVLDDEVQDIIRTKIMGSLNKRSKNYRHYRPRNTPINKLDV